MKTVAQLWSEFRAESEPRSVDDLPKPRGPLPPLPEKKDPFFSNGRRRDFNPVLAKLRLTREDVAAQAQAHGAPSQYRQWQENRRVAARLMRKGHSGRKGIPDFVVETMYRDYLDLGSLSKVAKIYGRTRQAMYCLFKAHGRKLNERNFHTRILFNGRAFTPGKHGYYRATDGEREPLHHLLWENQTGRKCPAGWQVFFKNGDNTDFRAANLDCLPIQEVTLQHYRRRFTDRAHLTTEQRKDFWWAHNREFMRKRSERFIQRGLRSDGKPRRRGRILRIAA